MFRHHVFISYAHADNQPVIEGQKGWITRFQDTLQVFLSERLGENVRIWLDATWQGDDILSEKSIDALRDAALFFCIVTPRYIRSEWCMRELEEFCRHAEQAGGLVVDSRSRVFKVIKTPLADTERLPDVLQDILEYRFYVEREQGEIELDPYFGESDKRDYLERIARLAANAAQMINRLEAVQAEAGAQRLEEKGLASRQWLEDKQSLSNRQNPTLENRKVPERRHLFISSSQADRAWVERLKRMIAPVLRGGGHELRLWDDSRLQPEMRWLEEMETALAEAKVALLLVSPEYLASEFGRNQAFLRLLAAAQAEGMVVLWVCLSPCAVMLTPIGEYPAVLPPDPSLAEMSDIQRDSALRTIAARIREALREPALEGEREERDSQPSPAPLVGDDETTAFEHILRWRVRCRIWREPLATEVDLPMVWVPSDTAAQVGEFLLGVEPVSLRQWREVAGWSSRENTLNLATPAQGDLDQPVTGISQEQALEFCRRLALHSGRYYELPSEEQWDHACRAGSTSPYSWGEAWSGRLARATANPWGLRRMHGSVGQWCRGGALRGGAANEPVGLRVCCLPFGTPYFHLDASKSQWRPRITRAGCARVLARPLSEAEFLQLEQALQRFHILGLLRLRLFLSLLADRLAGGADDPQHPLSLEMVPDGLRRLATPAAMDPFTTAAFAWQERDWRRLADSARPPQELLAELGLASGERQRAVLHAMDRAASAFPEPR